MYVVSTVVGTAHLSRHLDFFSDFSASAAALEGCSWIKFHTRGTFPVSLINSIGLAGGRARELS
jgi:hypothetical protein